MNGIRGRTGVFPAFLVSVPHCFCPGFKIFSLGWLPFPSLKPISAVPLKLYRVLSGYDHCVRVPVERFGV